MISRHPRWDLLARALALVVATVALWVGVALLDGATDVWSIVLTVAAIASLLATVLASPLLIYVALFVPRRVDDFEWRETVSLYRSRPALRSVALQHQAVAKTLSGLSTTQLAVAALLPDHSDAGRAAAQAEMDRRGISGTEVPLPTIPGFLGVQDLPTAEQSVFGGISRLRGLGLAVGAIAFAIAMVLIAWNNLVGEEMVARALAAGTISAVDAAIYSGQSSDSLPASLRRGGTYAAFLGRERASTVLIAFGVLGMVVYFLSSWLRSRPVRLLLLRKFNVDDLGKAYRHLIQTELAPFGHVIALSDRRVRRPYWAWLATLFPTSPAGLALAPIRLAFLSLLRMTDRTRWGPAFVANARDFRNLARRLHDRFELNTEVLLSANAYLVRTTDPWWKLCIQLFLTSADVIVLDVSQVTQGTSWEIEAINRLGLWGRVVLVANEMAVEKAEETLVRLGEEPFGDRWPDHAHVYRKTGEFVDRPDFRTSVFAALRYSVEAKAG